MVAWLGQWLRHAGGSGHCPLWLNFSLLEKKFGRKVLFQK